MSSYFGLAIHPITGVLHRVEYIDDYCGKHKYGIRFPTGLFCEDKVTPRNLNCHRCTECPDSKHHWLDNGAFGNGDLEGVLNEFTHVCKHCDAVGMVCDDCDGDGRCPVTPDGGLCNRCDGEGVLEES